MAAQTSSKLDSSTYSSADTAFRIQYGSGIAEGALGRDTIQFAGFEVQQQAFGEYIVLHFLECIIELLSQLGVVSNVTDTLLDTPVSGLLGLGFQSISTSGTKPFWQTLAEIPGSLDSPVMAFHLTRYVNDSGTRAIEPGGSFSIGTVNSSLYTGEIDYQGIPNGSVGYWVLPLTGVCYSGFSQQQFLTRCKDIDVNGTALELSADPPSLAAIDTGTTLVGGPSDIVQDIYANIPGSASGTGQYEGYYTFRESAWLCLPIYSYPQHPIPSACDTDVTISLRFGNSNKSWPISPADFRLLQLDDENCLGAFFELSNSSAVHSSGSITWIVGDTFLVSLLFTCATSFEPTFPAEERIFRLQGFSALCRLRPALGPRTFHERRAKPRAHPDPRRTCYSHRQCK